MRLSVVYETLGAASHQQPTRNVTNHQQRTSVIRAKYCETQPTHGSRYGTSRRSDYYGYNHHIYWINRLPQERLCAP